jgi:hypothetical protein
MTAGFGCVSHEEPTGPDWREVPPRTDGERVFRRWVVRTPLIRAGDSLGRVVAASLQEGLRPGDLVAVSEKVVAITQGRSVLLRTVRPRCLARFLSRHVRPLGHGLGLRRPETMEMAIREAGAGRILAAALVAAAARFVGRSGDFYRVAGRRVAAIDGPGPTTIAPFNQYIVLAPDDPDGVARRLQRRLTAGVAVVDVNDIGSEVLGAGPGVDGALVRRLLADNPMGQGDQRTPLVVLRPTEGAAGCPGPAAAV